MPSSAPIPPAAPASLSLNAASRNTTVSKPSRSTARNAIATSAYPDPAASADSVAVVSWPLRLREWRRIHTTMYVTMATATAPMTVSRPSCWRCGRFCDSTRKTTPTATHSNTEAPTPTKTQRSSVR
jgi:hypothetical protein